MIKVLHKALDILEYLGSEPETPKQLGRIAGDLDLNPATCARILKTLVNRHYADQAAPRGGYRLGPMSYSLSSKSVYRREIARIAAPIVAKCAGEIAEHVVVASYCRGKRYILAVTNGNLAIQPRTDVDYFDDVYTSATGRLLLAFRSPEELEDHIRTRGLPKELWKEITSRAALDKGLARIREERFCIKLDSEPTVAFAYPVYDGTEVVAALGVAMLKSQFSGKHKKTVLDVARRSAEEVTAAIGMGRSN